MNYLERRKKLYEKLADKGTLFLCSGFDIHRSADDTHHFSVNRNFYYLTGIDQKDSYLVVDLATKKETLYILDNDEKLARWIGYFLTHDEAKEISQIENIASSNDYESLYKEVFSSSQVFLDLEKHAERGGLDYASYFESVAKKYNEQCELIDVYTDIIKMRGIKDEEEIKKIRKTIHITRLALESVMKSLKDLNNEREAQALFEERISALGHATPSFDTIAGSGKNGTILHYHSNDCDFEKDSLILLDLGARIDYYNADITRTYPTSGKFSPLQRKIYSIVLECNKNIIAKARPGVSLRELQEFTIEFLATRCLEEKLIETKEEISDVYFHSISHHLGLDVHDPMGRDTILEEGNVISDEPGLYFAKYGIGVRIEDDLLITKDGCENLSSEIIKEIEDIENFMK